jgi:hypothetical protein
LRKFSLGIAAIMGIGHDDWMRASKRLRSTRQASTEAQAD